MIGSFCFADPELEAQFEVHQRPVIARLFTLWCGAQCGLLAASLATGFVVFGFSQHVLPLCGGQVAVLIYLITAACLVRIPAVGGQASLLFWVSSLLLLGWSGWMIHSLSRGLVEQAKEQEIPTVWKLVVRHLPSSNPFEAFLQKQLSGKVLLLYLLFNFLILDLIRFVGSLRCIASTCLALPIVILTTIFTSSDVSKDTYEMMAASVGLSVYAFFSSSHIIGMRRRQFELSQRVETLLRHETATLRRAHEVETAQKEASQRADSMLNHILKNIMADAIGCIDLALPQLPAECREELQRAVTCLMRGMKWCKGRQAMLMVAQDAYCPTQVPVNLWDFGQALVQGRQVTGQFPDEVVLLDPILCDIICENALVNASRHGHPDHPDVHFSVHTTAPSPADDCQEGVRLVTFRITNRPNPGRPRVTEEFVQRMLSEEQLARAPHSSALSEGLGLRHLFAAARALGMTVSLRQEDGRVVLCATCSARAAPAAKTVSPAPSADFPNQPLPSGLRILCLDDSDVARRLLKNALGSRIPDAEVLTFGSAAADIDVFQQEALLGADILVLDQNLDYDDVHALGSDVVRALVQQGFAGFICIRSANVSTEDLAMYFSSGAHQVIGKDIRAPQMVQTLLGDFVRFRSSQPQAEDLGLQRRSNGSGSCETPSLLTAPNLSDSQGPSTAELNLSRANSTTLPGALNGDSSNGPFYLGIVSPRRQAPQSPRWMSHPAHGHHPAADGERQSPSASSCEDSPLSVTPLFPRNGDQSILELVRAPRSPRMSSRRRERFDSFCHT